MYQEEDIKKLFGEKAYSIYYIANKWSWKELRFIRTVFLCPEPHEKDYAVLMSRLIKKGTEMPVKIVRP